MSKSSIEWTGMTWNPIAGCEAISPGCAHCYAATMTRRLEAMGQQDYAGLTTKKHFNGAVRSLPAKLAIPLKRKKPTTWFVNSMSDLFHDAVPFEFIAAVFGVMAACPQHTFQVLTKRAQRMCEWFGWMSTVGGVGKYIRSDYGRRELRGFFDAVAKTETVNGKRQRSLDDPWMSVMNGAGCNYGLAPLPNVWLGVSCEDQQRADERIPWLLKTPAAVRFLSCEPLLGPINLRMRFRVDAAHEMTSYPHELLHWVIAGGESGPGARPCDVAWIRSIVQQCQAADVACFVKQLGGKPYDSSDRDDECKFTSHEQWVNKAGSWLGGVSGGGVRYKKPEHVVCVDSAGRQCLRGEGFARAKDEGTFPVYWHPVLQLSDKKGGEPLEWPDDLRVRQFPREVANA